MTTPIFFLSYAHHLVATWTAAGLSESASLDDLEAIDLGPNHPDSRISTLLDQLPGYRAGNRALAERQVMFARIIAEDTRRTNAADAARPVLIETYLDPVTGEIRAGKDPRPNRLV